MFHPSHKCYSPHYRGPCLPIRSYLGESGVKLSHPSIYNAIITYRSLPQQYPTYSIVFLLFQAFKKVVWYFCTSNSSWVQEFYFIVCRWADSEAGTILLLKIHRYFISPYLEAANPSTIIVFWCGLRVTFCENFSFIGAISLWKVAATKLVINKNANFFRYLAAILMLIM